MSEKFKPLTVRLPESVLDALRKEAKASGRSLNSTIVDALTRATTGLDSTLPDDVRKQVEALAREETRTLDLQILHLIKLGIRTRKNKG